MWISFYSGLIINKFVFAWFTYILVSEKISCDVKQRTRCVGFFSNFHASGIRKPRDRCYLFSAQQFYFCNRKSRLCRVQRIGLAHWNISFFGVFCEILQNFKIVSTCELVRTSRVIILKDQEKCYPDLRRFYGFQRIWSLWYYKKFMMPVFFVLSSFPDNPDYCNGRCEFIVTVGARNILYFWNLC